MRRILAAIVVVVIFAGGARAATTVYNNESDFLAAIGSASYLLEDFDGYTYGSYFAPTLDLGPVNGYSCTLSAIESLWSDDGNMSTNSPADSLDVVFTGEPVLSVGGFFWASDISGFYVPGQITLTFSDGTIEIYGPPNDLTFRGFVSDIPVASMSIDAPDVLGDSWPTMDHFYVGGADQGGGGGGGTGGAGQPIPTMSTSGMIVLVLAMIGVAFVLIRRRF